MGTTLHLTEGAVREPVLREGTLREGIEYGRVGDLRLEMDAWIPDGRGPFPAVVIVHGGGWVAGDRRHDVEPLFAPLSEGGFAWFSISYRLAMDLTLFGAAIQDVEQAVRHIRANARRYRIDANRIGLIGESAGAHLASMAALQGECGSVVQAVVALYSPMDLLNLARTSPRIPEKIREVVNDSTLGPIFIESLKQLSPIHNVRKDVPPFLLIHGTADTLVPFEHSERMYLRLKEAGAGCDLYPVPGAGHGIRAWENFRADCPYKQFMVHWLQKELGMPVCA